MNFTKSINETTVHRNIHKFDNLTMLYCRAVFQKELDINKPKSWEFSRGEGGGDSRISAGHRIKTPQGIT